MRQRVRAGILGCLVLLTGALWFFTRAYVYAPTSTPPVYVVRAAEEMAKASADPHPVLAYAIRTTEAVALTGSPNGNVAAPETRVYLVMLYGQFTADWASPPAGAALPTGTVVTFTINQKTHRVMDMGLGHKTPSLVSLESFGPLQSFTVP